MIVIDVVYASCSYLDVDVVRVFHGPPDYRILDQAAIPPSATQRMTALV